MAFDPEKRADDSHLSGEVQVASILHHILRSTEDVVGALDADGRVIEFNPAGRAHFQRAYGVRVERGVDLFEALSHRPKDQREVRQAWERALAGESFIHEEVVESLPRDQRYHESRYSPLRNEAGEIVGAVVVSREVTSRKEAEAEAARSRSELAERVQRRTDELQESQERLLAALQASGTGTFRWDIRTNAVQWDEALERLFGLEPGQFDGTLEAFIERVHPDDREDVRLATRRCLATGGRFDRAFRVVWSDGTVRWLDDKGKVFFDERGRPAYMTGACTDVTHRKWSEKVVQRKEMLEKLVDNIPVMLCFYDRDGNVLLANEAMETRLGYTQEELQQIDVMETCYPDPALRERVWAFMMSPGSAWREFEMTARGGDTLLVSWMNVELSDGSQIGIGLDITERKRLEQQRERLLEQLRREQGLLEFKNRQLHALALDLTQAEHRERRRVAHLLHEHFQQLLVAAKIQLDHSRLSEQMPEVLTGRLERTRELLDESIQASRDLAVELCPPVLYVSGLGAALEWLGDRFGQQHGLSVEVAADPEPVDPPLSEAVQVLLFQAAQELLLNVVKHAGVERARVEMAVSDAHVRVVVSDGGQGCDAAEVLPQQGEPRGFGLFSLQQRLELLGGGLTLEGALGEGCRVTVEAPRLTEASAEAGGRERRRDPRRVAAAPADEAEGEAPLRVLLVDDHKILRQGLVSLLEGEAGLAVVGEAGDGEEALECVRSLRPDVVVMDVSMPRMDGATATRLIRQDYPGVRVVGLSMHANPQTRQAMLDAGATSYLTKGGPAQELADAIRGA